jgi:hypothetical protein
MRKIHNIHDLRQAQKAVEQRRQQLEKELQRDWNDIKDQFSAGSNSFLSYFRKEYTGNLLTQGLSFGAGLLTRKLGSKIGGKLFSWLK